MPDAEHKVDRASCWIDRDLLQLAKEIAARERLSVSTVLERDLDAAIRRRHRKVFPADYADLGEAGA